MIRFISLVLAAGGTWFFYDLPFPGNCLALATAGFGFYTLYEMLRPEHKPYVLRIGSLKWTQEDFCRGWLITGKTGCGKTASAILRILFGLSTEVPNWGGMALDDKGLFYRVLVKMFAHFHRSHDLRLIQVRPDNAPPDWKPLDTWNPLSDKSMPYSAHCKIITDVAASFSSNTNSFFSQQAMFAMEYAMRALDLTGHDVSFVNVYNVTTNPDDLNLLIKDIVETEKRCDDSFEEAGVILDFFLKRFLALPPETLGGLRGEIVRYLKFFTEPKLVEIFSAAKSTVSLTDMDAGKVICISVPQKYASERIYINTLAKFYFYLHALRRFDITEDELKKRNLIVLVSDENQNIVTASEEGMSDYKIVDRIREAKATVVAATQSPTSYFPAFKSKEKAMVYINNLTNRLIFTAADKEGAEISANLLPPLHIWEYTYSSGKGGAGSNRKRAWKQPLEWGQLVGMKKFECVVQHCEKGFRRMMLAPITPEGIVPDWFKGKKKKVQNEDTPLRAESIPDPLLGVVNGAVAKAQ